MKATHQWGTFKESKAVNSDTALFLGNRIGGYAYFQQHPSSRYHGFFCRHQNHLFRIIENIYPEFSEHAITEVVNAFSSVQRKRDTVIETMWCPVGKNALVYELSKKYTAKLILDIKKTYDNREWGRHYRIEEKNGVLVVSFTKTSHHKEDTDHEQQEYKVFLAIAGYSSHQHIDQWLHRQYEADKHRNSNPHERHVYEALSLGGKTFVFSVGWTEQEAIEQAHAIHSNLSQLKQEQKKYFGSLFSSKQTKKLLKQEKVSNQQKLAWLCAISALDTLQQDDDVYAGFPWFFQHWSRDSLVTAKALGYLHNGLDKKILRQYSSEIHGDGNMANHKGGIHSNADGLGWWINRTTELDNKNRSSIIAAQQAARRLLASHTADSLATNDSQATWMDTKEEFTHGRGGIRVEIQAQRLALYNYLYTQTKDKKYKLFRDGLLAKVRSTLWNGRFLADGKDDFTVRPNVFLAAYLYPDLLSKTDWNSALWYAIDRLWCRWGGLTSIDTKHFAFTDRHTGETNQSYHRGDSWFWINNLAAQVMHNMDSEGFQEKIQSILHASTAEMLWSGALGCQSEVSSAAELSSKGCFNQAWSNALYLELLNTVYLK